jgi:hypothetical protein
MDSRTCCDTAPLSKSLQRLSIFCISVS